MVGNALDRTNTIFDMWGLREMAKPGWFLPVRIPASHFNGILVWLLSLTPVYPSLHHRNSSQESGICSIVVQPRGPPMHPQEPGQHGTGGLLRQAQAVIAIDQTYGTLDWYDLPSTTPPPLPGNPINAKVTGCSTRASK